MNISTAFPKTTVDQIFSPWIKAINSRECISVLNIPKRDQLYRIKEFEKQPIFDKNSKLITLDLKGEIIEDSADLESYLKKMINPHSKKLTIVILDADQLTDEKTALLSNLDKLYFDNKIISLAYLFQKNITESEMTKRLSSYTSLFQNVSVFSYFKPEDMSHFIKFMVKNFKIKITEKLGKKILDRCGGAPWLIKESVRYYSQTLDEKNMFNHDNMKLKLKILYQELSEKEKLVVEKITKNNYHFDTQEKTTVNYLLHTKFLIKHDQKYDISIPILKDSIIKILNEKTQLTLNPEGQLIINNVLIEGFFSRREKRIIKLFLENIEKTLSREKIALAVWLNNKDNAYTDWALDQLIRRLRNKFIKLGLSRQLIKTIKNQGYLFTG